MKYLLMTGMLEYNLGHKTWTQKVGFFVFIPNLF